MLRLELVVRQPWFGIPRVSHYVLLVHGVVVGNEVHGQLVRGILPPFAARPLCARVLDAHPSHQFTSVRGPALQVEKGADPSERWRRICRPTRTPMGA